jgi:putative transposase
MPRAARVSIGDQCYHVLNRGNARRRVFYKDGDYQAFVKAMGHASVEVPIRVLAWCLMPNHFHLVLWPHHDRDLSHWMHWLLNTHVRRYHRHHRSSGHLWQGRFKAFAIEHDDHLLAVLRYVERNPLRANLVKRAEHWEWSSLHGAASSEPRPAYWHEGPVPRQTGWLEWVNAPVSEAELTAMRACVQRNRPYGADGWQRSMAARLGLESSLRPRGRPRTKPEGQEKEINAK